MAEYSNQKPPGVILAGGSARRLGKVDKCLLMLSGRSLLTHIRSRLEPQTAMLLLNINSQSPDFDRCELTRIKDNFPPGLGPLAGIASTMQWLRKRSELYPWLCTVPGDSPFLPADLVCRLMAEIDSTAIDIVYAMSDEREHFVVGLWSSALLPKLLNYLAKGERAVGKFIHQQRCKAITFDSKPFDPFFNINTAEDLKKAKCIADKY